MGTHAQLALAIGHGIIRMCLGCGSNPCLAAVTDTASQYVGLTSLSILRHVLYTGLHTSLTVINQNIGVAQIVVKRQNRS